MLHRSFKAGKCKTSLKLAVARIKLLKNKREAQLRQMKRDLAQLLESGQEQTARIRVEHVVREEKTMAAYDLVDVYCELIVARLPIIESQKNCPIDLKEAIASVIFASPRCADVPELMDARKHFTTKYGKEFVASALELRPDCGVNRTMVEKLSARAPDGQTKIKILTAIAQEHNVKWDPEAFGEKELKPPEDLLNGPSTFVSASKMPMEHPSVQLPPTHGQKHEVSMNFSQKDIGSSQSSQAFGTANISAPNMTKATISQPELRASESGTEGRDFRSSSLKDGNTFSSNRQNWNMEFKDATSAAQAAAESAERASIAARAAAELSSYANITRQYSTESHKPLDSDLRDGPGKLAGPKLKGEHASKDSEKMVHKSQKSSSYDINPRSQNQQRERNERENLQGVAGSRCDGYDSVKRRSRQSVSSGSSITSTDDDILVTDLPNTHRYQKSSSEVEAVNPNWQSKKPAKGDFLDEVSSNIQSNQSEVESVKNQRSNKTEKSDQSREGRIRKQSGKSASSHSHVSNDDDDIISDPDLRRYGNNGGERSFINTSHGNVQRTNQPSFKDSPAVVVDEYVSHKDYNASTDDDILVTDLPNTHRYQKSSSEVEDVNPNWQTKKPEKGDFLDEVSSNVQSNQSEVESVKNQRSNRTEKSDQSREGRIRKQSGKSASSRSHVSNDDNDDIISDPDLRKDGNNGGECSFINTSHRNVQSTNQPSFKDGPAVVVDEYVSHKDCNFGVEDEYNRHEMDSYIISDPDLWKYGNNGGEHSFINTSHGNVQSTNQPSFKDAPTVVFDEYVLHKDCNFGVEDEYNRNEMDSYAPSPVRRSPSHSSSDIHNWSPRKKRSVSLEENSSAQLQLGTEPSSPVEVSSKLDDFLPATFDESDAQTSESEDEKDNFKLYGRTESSILPQKQNVFTRSPGSSQTDSDHASMKSSFTRKESIGAYREPWLHSSFDDSKPEDVRPERNQEIQMNVGRESTLIDRDRGSMKTSLREKEAAGINRKPWLDSSSDDSESEVSLSIGNQETKLNVGDGSLQADRGHGSMISSAKREATGMSGKPWLNSSSDDSESEAAHIKRNQETKLKVGGESWKKYNQGNLPTAKLYPRHARSPRNSDGLDHEPFYGPGIEEKQQPLQSSRLSYATEVKAKDDFRASGSPNSVKISEFSDHLSSESGQELNLKRLTGGFRNKTFSRPPYARGPSVDASPLSTHKAAEDTPPVIEQPVVSPVIKSSTSFEAQDQELHNQKPILKFPKEPSSSKAKAILDSVSDDAEVMPPNTVGSRGHKGEILKFPKGSSSSKEKTILDSDSDDAEVMPRQTVSSRGYKGERLSRRTRGTPARSGTSGLLNLASAPEVPVTSDSDMGRKLSPQISHETEMFSKPQTQMVSSGSEENSKWKKSSTSFERQSFKPTPQPQVSQQKESVKSRLPKTNSPVEQQPSKPTQQSKVSVHESSFKSSQLSSSVERPSNALPKSVPSRSTETPKPSSLNEGSDPKGDSFKKATATHVHPKLPDYDTLAAHFESLRSNHRSS